jgi:C4-dicarboxylate transporter
VLALGQCLGQCLAIFIPSASGLGLLLMVTMYPILVRLGVSPLAATAMIGTTQCLDIGPASGNSMLAAQQAGMDILPYFASHQVPVALCVTATVAFLHFVVQQAFDRKAGHVAAYMPEEAAAHPERHPVLICGSLYMLGDFFALRQDCLEPIAARGQASLAPLRRALSRPPLVQPAASSTTEGKS